MESWWTMGAFAYRAQDLQLSFVGLWADDRALKWDDPQLLWPALALVGALLLGAAVIYCVDLWRKKADLAQASGEDEMTRYRALYESGELSQEEYDRLKALLSGRLRKQLNLSEPQKSAEVKPPEPPSTDIQAG
jgi:hypothetical protein